MQQARITKWFSALAGLAVLGGASSQALAQSSPRVPADHGERRLVTVRHIALQGGPRTATLTLTVNGPVEPRLFRLGHPDRLVIDLPHTRRQAALPAGTPTNLIIGVRSGVRPGHELRLVLQLQGHSPYHLRWLSATQLSVELGSPAFAVDDAAARRNTDVAPSVAASAPLTASVPAAHAPSGAREVIVAIDPGHGGVDPGATGPDGVHEKDVTLAIARSLAVRIDAVAGMRAVLTRDGDYFVPLRDRMNRARAAHADLFVSIHADSVGDPLVSGASVYTLSERGASSEAARQLAEQENAADLKGGISLAAQTPDLRSVLLSLSQNASMGQSGEAAQDVLRALDHIGPVRKLEVQHAAFVVLKSPDVPSMLVETAYISNRTDEHRLRSPLEQRQLAEAIFSGIAAYFQQYPPQGSLFARTHAVASSPSS